MGLLKKLRRIYPLTFLGSFMILASLVLLSISVLREQPLGQYVAALGLIVPVASALGAYLVRGKFSLDMINWDLAPHLTSGEELPWFRLNYEGHSPVFYRLHLKFRGGLWAGNRELYSCRWSRPLEKGEWMEAPGLPATGELKLKVHYGVTDLLGLSRWPLHRARDLEWAVLPRTLGFSDRLPPLLSDSEEDQRAMKKDEWERIFTREYMAGDLARDINWKSSAKIGKLITRIPPESLGESPQMQVFFRSPKADQRRLSLFHLEHLKSMMYSFLKEQLHMDSKRSFRVYLNRELVEFSGKEELPLFMKELSRTGFSSSYSEYPLPQDGRESCIFATCLDEDLPRQFKGLDRQSLYLFVTAPVSVEKAGPRYRLIYHWPAFLPKGSWLRGGHIPSMRIPHTLGHIREFPLEGRL